MHSDPQIPDWMERIHSGKATPDEVDRLRRHPGVDPSQLEEELQLNRLLETLPPVSVPSNLASRVLDAIHLEAQQTLRRHRWDGWLSWIAWRPAWVSVAVACLALLEWRIQSMQRTTLARSVLIVSETTAVPGMEALVDFEAIQWLESRPEPGDLELMAALSSP